ncbi:hypothetical protein [Rhodococcus sp. NPDC057529]|uniref:hypothetical protein n=1 Tax=Rhodococcus sp. NPDC057529 TaxID=3346158 RepID=UPI00367183AA
MRAVVVTALTGPKSLVSWCRRKRIRSGMPGAGGDAFDEAVRVLAQAGLVLDNAVLVQD